jgi:hypothetical protein
VRREPRHPRRALLCRVRRAPSLLETTQALLFSMAQVCSTLQSAGLARTVVEGKCGTVRPFLGLAFGSSSRLGKATNTVVRSRHDRSRVSGSTSRMNSIDTEKTRQASLMANVWRKPLSLPNAAATVSAADVPLTKLATPEELQQVALPAPSSRDERAMPGTCTHLSRARCSNKRTLLSAQSIAVILATFSRRNTVTPRAGQLQRRTA